jgi:signal transduction histidine kinase
MWKSDAALALLVFAGSLVLLAAGDGHGDPDAWGVALTALASLPLAARRVTPLGVFVLTGAASVALRALAEPAGPPLGPTVALYFAVLGGRTRPTFAVAAALLLAHAAVMARAAGVFPGTAIAFGVTVWGGAWLAADRARLRQERMAELEQRALRAERDAQRERRLAAAEERTRIARDLHDSAGHALNVILVHAGLGRLRAAGDDATRETFETIEDVARQTVADIDQLVTALRDGTPGVEPPPGLAALDTLVRRHREAGLDVTTRISGQRRPLAPGVDRGAYRILQEALTNTARHGRGQANVDIVFAGELELTVDNPVDGAPARGGGHGLVGMRERAALLGGSVETAVRDGSFHVHARLPLSGAQ